MGRVVGKSYARQPMNLGTWEPDVIGYIYVFNMEQKLSARLKSHLHCKFSIIRHSRRQAGNALWFCQNFFFFFFFFILPPPRFPDDNF